MNIQIFGTKKSSDTRKAERFFKERGIKFQFVDLKEKGLSKGEFQSVLQAVGGLEAIIDRNCKDKDLLALIKYIAAEDKAQKVLENQVVLKQPIVRNGKQATKAMLSDIQRQAEYEKEQMERLKASGKEKSATYRQYLGNRMLYKMMLDKY